MRRQLLVAVIALGGVVTLIGATGIFAVFTDRATTSENSVTSGERPHAADLKLALLVSGSCQTFVDDLNTGLFTESDAQPADPPLATADICLKNAGASSLDATLSAIDLTDSETDCTGDEEAAGDTSCGTGVGELSSLLQVQVGPEDCTTHVEGTALGISALPALTSSGIALGSLEPDGVACLHVRVFYDSGSAPTAIQMAQTDSVTWRFAFDGATA